MTTALLTRLKQQSLRAKVHRPPTAQREVNPYTLKRSVCRESYFEFVKTFWHTVCAEPYVHNWHVEYFCNELQRVMERVFRWQICEEELLCNCPPGMSKSITFTVLPLAWAWTRMLSFKFIGVSYGHHLALRLSRFTRQCVTSDLYRKCFPEVQLSKDQNCKGDFANTKGGERFSMGIDSGVIGYHGHVIGIDDPISPKDALSPTQLVLQSTCDVISDTLTSRKVDKDVAATWMVMQRVGVGDPSEFYLQREPFHICLPCWKDDKTLPFIKPAHLHTRYDEQDGLLDPKRLTLRALTKLQKGLTTAHSFSAQYEQLPIPREGGQFKVANLKYADAPPSRSEFKRGPVRYWDKAGTEAGRGGAATASVKMALDKQNRVWVLDVDRFFEDTFERNKRIMDTARRDGRDVEIGQEVEPGSGGKESAQFTVQQLLGFKVYSHRVGKNDGDKVARAGPFSSQVNAGNVILVRGPWNDQYVKELEHFGETAKYKDQVDASSGAFHMLTRMKILGGLTRKRELGELP